MHFSWPLFIVLVGVLDSDVRYAPQGCGLAVKRVVLLWPPIFPTAHSDPTLCSQPRGELENYFFLKKYHVCLFWWLSFASNQ